MIALSLTVVVVLIAFLASRQTNQRGTVEFFGAADEATALHEEAAQTFGQALASIGVITRQDLTRRLESVVDRSTEGNDLLVDVTSVPFVIGTSYGTMMTASTSWTGGAEEVNRVVVGIMDGDIVETAVPELQKALNELGVGDVAYEQYQESLVMLPETADSVVFPSFRYVDPDLDDPLRFNATSLVLRIQSAYSLSPHHDVSISGMTEPNAVGARDGIPVVPFADSIGVTVLVTNEGNEDEKGIEVALDVVNVDTGDIVSRSDVVVALPAGASTTLTFADLEIEPGSLYQAILGATISVDINPENNTWDTTFIWNGES